MSLSSGVGSGAERARRESPSTPTAQDGPADPALAVPRAPAAGRPLGLLVAHDRHARGRPPRSHRGLRRALARICEEAEEVVEDGVTVLILSDRALRPRPRADPGAAGHVGRPPPPRARGHAPAHRPDRRVRRAARGPPLLHADRLRRRRGQPVPDVRVRRRDGQGRPHPRRRRSRGGRAARRARALGKGLLKTLSKMGISTISSYCGAQIFEAVGLERGLVDKYFTGTASRIGGVGLDVLAEEAMTRHDRGFPRRRVAAADARRRGRPAGGRAAVRRHLPVAPRRRAPPVGPEGDRDAAARGADQLVGLLPGVRRRT